MNPIDISDDLRPRSVLDNSNQVLTTLNPAWPPYGTNSGRVPPLAVGDMVLVAGTDPTEPRWSVIEIEENDVPAGAPTIRGRVLRKEDPKPVSWSDDTLVEIDQDRVQVVLRGTVRAAADVRANGMTGQKRGDGTPMPIHEWQALNP